MIAIDASKTTAFIVWIILCIKRPWENDWKLSFDQEDRKKLRFKIKEILNKRKINCKFNIDKETTRAFSFISELTEINEKDEIICSKDFIEFIELISKIKGEEL